MKNIAIKKRMERVGYCGLFCEGCSLYIGTTEEPTLLARLAVKYDKEVDEVKCLGCRGEKQSFNCRNCKIKECAISKGIEFCSSCDEFACDLLIEFQRQLPHRNELFESLELLKQGNYEVWFEKMDSDYTCPKCKNTNSPYETKCRVCGSEPSSDFYLRNKKSIKTLLESGKR